MTLWLESSIGWVVAASAALDFIVGVAMLLVRMGGESATRSRIGLRRLAAAFGVTTLVFAVKATFLVRLGVDPFGLIALIYTDLVVVVPLLGLVVLGASIWGRPTAGSVRGLVVLSLLALPIGWYATFWEPFNLKTEAASVPIAAERAGRSPLRIAVLSDLQTRHVTDYERGAVDRILAMKPDLILLPGDIFQGSEEALDRELPALHDLLSRLDAPGGVYYAPGDVDQAPGRPERLFEGTKVKRLVNDMARVRVRDRMVTIGGVELRYSNPEAMRLVDQFEDARGTDDIRILLGHRPDVVLRLRERSRIDLVVAGHTHGGQIVVPGFGPLMTLSDVPRQVAAGGLHTLDGNLIYVSRGVGCERAQAPRIRFLCPPEVSILTLGGAR
jgi:predicted MPP superfamily phosphohydrolase